MRYKATFIAGFAAGFLAGSRAGRGVYDKIVATGQQVASHPKVQEATTAAQAKATGLARTAAAKAPDAAKNAATSVAKTVQAQASQVPSYATAAKKAAQSKLPSQLGGTSTAAEAGHGDVAPDGTLIYPVEGVTPSVNGTQYSPDTP